jgi:outer membrane protein assembly factor BamE (lipoprotein component of BamABCDE complex)
VRNHPQGQITLGWTAAATAASGRKITGRVAQNATAARQMIDIGSTVPPYAIVGAPVHPPSPSCHQGSYRVPASFAYFRPCRCRVAAALLLCYALTACSWLLPPPQTRGNRVEQEQLKELVPGTSSKADVTALIGSPTQRAMFDENTWLYISEVTRPRLGQTLGVLDQTVVVLTFDDRGVTNNEAVSVDVASRTTPSPGTEASFMQQLLGNVGKFSPVGGTGGASVPGGGAPRPSSSP